MSLPACQQRILDGIAGTLRARDPRLVSMFAIFTRLTRTEPMPINEALDASHLRLAAHRLRLASPRLHALMILPVVLAAVAGLFILGPVAGSAHSCGMVRTGRAYVQLAGRFGICRTAQTTPSAGIRQR